jgi:transcriptional regulator with XRE-family HTH domain
MARRRYSLRDKLVTLSQTQTQKQIAKKLRVSDRTIRRWKNEGVEPASYLKRIERVQDRLQDEFEREHKRVEKSLRDDRRKHPNAPKIERKVKILPPAARRELKVYEAGRDTGRTKSSDWINYDVAALNIKEIFEIVRALRDEGRIVQLIYRIPKGARYPRDARGRPGKVVSKSTRSGTPPLDLSNLDDGELMDFLMRYTSPERGPKSLHILYVSALDQMGGRRRDPDDEDEDEGEGEDEPGA